MSKKYDYNFVKTIVEQKNLILHTTKDEYEILNMSVKTPLKISCLNNHDIFYPNFDSIKNKNTGCKKCSDIKNSEIRKTKYKDIVDFINTNLSEFKLLTTIEDYNNNFKNNKSKIKLKCQNNHIFDISFIKVKTRGDRCRTCSYINNSDKNHYRWIEDRTLVSLNKRIRKKISKIFVKNNLKHDPNYNDYFVNSKLYNIDHNPPIKAYTDYIIKNNLENDSILIDKIRNEIANNVERLSIMSVYNNRNKWYKYDKEKFEIWLKNLL